MVYQTSTDKINSKSLSSDQNKKIFLGNLSHNTTDETLREFCSRFGKINDCLVMKTREGKPRGFGFVTYEDTSSVEDFMRSRPHTIDNRQIDTKRAMPREDQTNTQVHASVKKLFIGNLYEGINEGNLREYFSRFGNITEVFIMKHSDGRPRGFAFITFDDYDAVDKIILEKPHLINGRTLDVKKAIPKEQMQGITKSTQGHSEISSNRNTFNGNREWDNQPQHSSYGQQGYNSSGSGYNPLMSSNMGGFTSSYNSIGQNQSSSRSLPQQSMMNYNPNMSFNNNTNQTPNSNFRPSSYGQNSQQGFNGMNNSFNPPSQQTNSWTSNGYNNGSSLPTPFNNSNSYGMASQNYGNTGFNYNNTPQQQTRGVGPMHSKRGRGGGPSGNNNSSTYGNRSAPYPKRGSSSTYSGRGRGRGQ